MNSPLNDEPESIADSACRRARSARGRSIIGRVNTRRGQLLIAAADLMDPNFHRTVSLLVEHGDGGALGLVLNRPLDTRVASAWSRVSDEPCAYEGPLMRGGPCDGPLMLLHDQAACSQIEVCPGVHFTADEDHVTRLIGEPPGRMRCFVGYAGWGAAQLETELDTGSWIVRPAASAAVFEPPDDPWMALIRDINPTQAALVRNPGLMPEDPSVN